MIGGNSVHVVKFNGDTALDVLPPRVYTVKYEKNQGFYYLDIVGENLHVPEKIYGTVHARTEKCINTYKDRSTSTGILLTGDKGTGKSLLTAMLANAAIAELKLPVLVIKEAYEGEKFMSFIESVGECCLLFDEFGKMYSKSSHSERPKQDVLLTMMDGIDKTKRFIIMTENSEFEISEFMLGRPSRIYYHFRYTKLDELSIQEYCDDYNLSRQFTADVIALSRHMSSFSFDVLQTIVEEHQRFGTPVSECVVDLNINSTTATNKANIKITSITTKDQKPCVLSSSSVIPRPTRGAYIYIKEEDDDSNEIYISDSNLKYEHGDNLVYETGSGYIVTAKVLQESIINYSSLIG